MFCVLFLFFYFTDPECSLNSKQQCFPRKLVLTIAYYQLDKHNKRIIFSTLAGSSYDQNQSNTDYSLSTSYYALGYIDLILNFAYSYDLFCVLFIFVGIITVLLVFIAWVIHRLTTYLENPPEFKFASLWLLTVPPAAVCFYLRSCCKCLYCILPFIDLFTYNNEFISYMLYLKYVLLL